MNAQLVLENVTVRLPSRLLFEEVNWSLYEGMRVALAGRNGCGKSTLMRILAGTGEPTEGKCNVVGGKRLRIGFLDQSLLDSAALEHQQSTASPVAFIEQRLLMDHADDDDMLDVTWEIRKLLSGLGFIPEWMDRPMHELSGGWLLRVFIAEALAKKPDVLLLDEPTNHLDISSIQWLEEFLVNEYRGSLVLITHDISLQRKTTDSIAILHGGRFFFRKHQNDYLSFRESLGEEKRLIEKSLESIDKKIQENMDFVLKFRAKASTAARAQSKLKMAETLTAERQSLRERLAQIEGAAYNLRFGFRHSNAGSKFPVSAVNASFRYSEDAPWILKNVTFDVPRGQRVAIIGDNGTGKTTLLNVLGERLKPQQGEIVYGHGIALGYFGQHQLDELSIDDTILDNLRARAEGVGLEQLRGWLGAFGFSGNDEIQKKARVLSGGERARLALLRILVTQINVCLLDEPTNHLDIETKDLLKKAMQNFEGTVLFVSHDREFISDIADRILYLSHDHQLIDHIGNLASFFAKYPEYVRHSEARAKPSAPTQAAKASAPTGPVLSFEERKKLKNQARSLEKKIAASEQEIDALGKQKEQAAAASDVDMLATLEAKLHNVMMQWEKWEVELEEIKQRVPDLV